MHKKQKNRAEATKEKLVTCNVRECWIGNPQEKTGSSIGFRRGTLKLRANKRMEESGRISEAINDLTIRFKGVFKN